MNAIVKQETGALALAEDELLRVLQSSLYPGANVDSIRLVLGYCKASGLDPMQKPVHIVPMWDSKAGQMRDVVMPGVNLYRTQASRSNQMAGISEPEFGPMVTATIGGQEITFPEWCKVTVRRERAGGAVAEFSAIEYWMENYAVKGGKEKSIAPNAMWTKRPRGQIAKCAEAQALRKAFPEIGGAYTAEEMEGKTIQAEERDMGQAVVVQREQPPLPGYAAEEFDAKLPEWAKLVTGQGGKTAQALLSKLSTKRSFTEEQKAKILSLKAAPAQPEAKPEPEAKPKPEPAATTTTDPWVDDMNAAEGRGE